MNTVRSLIFAVSAGLLFTANCAAPDGGDAAGDEEVGTAEQATGVNDPPASQNGRDPLCNAQPTTKTGYLALATYALGHIPSKLPFSDTCRREVIGNAVHCALPKGVSVFDADGFEYDGWEGLAPQWQTDALPADSGRWVTGCMVQRLNATGKHVDILPEGNTPPIYAQATLETSYPYNESNAWGNYFDPTNTSPYSAYVCYNVEVVDACTTTSMTPEQYLNSRYCDGVKSPLTCAIKVMGACSDVCFQSTTGYATCVRPDGTWDDHTVHVRLEGAPACVAP